MDKENTMDGEESVKLDAKTENKYLDVYTLLRFTSLELKRHIEVDLSYN